MVKEMVTKDFYKAKLEQNMKLYKSNKNVKS